MPIKEMIGKIRAASAPPENKVNFEEVQGQAEELLQLLCNPNVVNKLCAVDPSHGSRPTYELINSLQRDDNSDTVTLLLSFDTVYLHKDVTRSPVFCLIEVKTVYLDASVRANIVRVTRYDSQKGKKEYFESSWPEYRWNSANDESKIWVGKRNLDDSLFLAISHGSQLEKITEKILTLIQPAVK